jgi:hypothetical protein
MICSYLESIEIIYTANTFSLKGTRGITAFKSVIPPPQWQMIRRVHISTMFLTPKRIMPAHGYFPPENFSQWPMVCQTLKDMQALRSLCIEMIVWDIEYCDGSGSVDDESLAFILEPLNRVVVPVFEVELNIPIPDVVLTKLGQITFNLVVKQRPFNHGLTPISF